MKLTYNITLFWSVLSLQQILHSCECDFYIIVLVKEQQNITLADRERLMGYLEGTGKVILPEPQALLTEAAKMPGPDGQKMSKSYNNYIFCNKIKRQIIVVLNRKRYNILELKNTLNISHI